MKNNYLIHYGHGHEQPHEYNFVSVFAKFYNIDHIHIGISELHKQNIDSPIAAFWDFANNLKYANFAIIWNGMQCYGPLITKICKEKKIPRCYIEWGMLPQTDNFFIDPIGFCGDSILHNDISWVKQDDVDYMYNKRSELQLKYNVCDKKYILIPLQIENDSQILFYSKYKNMYDFVLDVIKMYPDHKIIIKTHPKNNITKYFKSWNNEYTKLIVDNKVSILENNNISFMSLAAEASLIIGITSTCLYEASILGKETIALGNHPLANKYLNRDQILAGSLVLNLDRKTGDLKKVLDRFSLHPLS